MNLPTESESEQSAESKGRVARLKERLLRLVPGVVKARQHRSKWLAATVVVAHCLGALTSIHAIMDTRTSQGAIAWAVSLKGTWKNLARDDRLD